MNIVPTQKYGSKPLKMKHIDCPQLPWKMVWNFYKNRWTRTFKQNKKSI
jgi:hypothetical protein